MIVSYSDGEGKDAGIGFAVWVPGRASPLAAYSEVPTGVRKLWAQAARGVGEVYNDIYLIEVIAPLMILCTFPKVMRNAMWLHFIDNVGGERALVRGASTQQSADHIVGLTWQRIQSLAIVPYFDRVDSKANPVDGLSRKVWDGPWNEVHTAVFPIAELMALAAECNDDTAAALWAQ